MIYAALNLLGYNLNDNSVINVNVSDQLTPLLALLGNQPLTISNPTQLFGAYNIPTTVNIPFLNLSSGALPNSTNSYL